MNIRTFPAKYKYISDNPRLLARYDGVRVTDKTSKAFDVIKTGLDSFNYVAVDVNGDKSLIKEIVTFFDNTGRIIERYFLENGISKRKNRYSYYDDVVSVHKYNENLEHQTTPNPDFIRLCNGVSDWYCTETYKSIYRNGKKSAKNAVLCKKVTALKHTQGANYARNYSFAICPVAQKSKRKQNFSVILENIYNYGTEKAKILNPIQSRNLNVNMQDDFLQARIIGILSENGLGQLVKVLLDRKGLSKMNVRTYACEMPPAKIGGFCMDNKSSAAFIDFNEKFIEFGSVDKLVDTAGHEADHAYRYALIGRLGSGTTGYEIYAKKVLGILNAAEQEEAIRCKVANDNYVTYETNPQEYRDNYLEVKAREAGEEAVEEFKRDKTNYEFFSMFEGM